MSCRLYTSGWDFFAPSRTVIYHLWSRDYRPVFQELQSIETQALQHESLSRVKGVLQGKIMDEFSLGDTRSMREYEIRSGIDFENQIIEWRAKWGGRDPIEFALHAPEYAN